MIFILFAFTLGVGYITIKEPKVEPKTSKEIYTENLSSKK